MNKNRLEALSDGVFAIVFTLLVIEIKVPEHITDLTSSGLWHALVDLSPLFVGYTVSFVVLAMYWISHSFAFSMFVKNINRQLSLINLLFLAFIALLPFSAHLIGRYGDVTLAACLYGVHLLIISLISNLMFFYATRSHEIDTAHNSPRIIAQARIRQLITPMFTVLGIILALTLSTKIAFICFMFPIIFNITPGSLDFIERKLGLKLGED